MLEGGFSRVGAGDQYTCHRWVVLDLIFLKFTLGLLYLSRSTRPSLPRLRAFRVPGFGFRALRVSGLGRLGITIY